MLRGFFFIWLVLTVLCGLIHAEQLLKAAVAAPPMDGTVSVGVFNENGECVRVLLSHVSSDDVPSALNGFSLSWDGKTDEGETVPAGAYEFRGVILGDIKIEGVAYHLNDWIDPDAPDATPISTWGVLALADREFLAVQKTDGGEWRIFSYRPDGSVSWSRLLAGEPQAWTATGGVVVVLCAGKFEQFSLADGNSVVWGGDYDMVTAMSADEKGLLGVVDRDLVRWNLVTREREVLARVPPGIRFLAAGGERVYVSNGKSVMRSEYALFLPLDLPDLGEIRGMTTGKNGALWVVSEREGLTEFSMDGEALRGLVPELEESFVAASTDGKRIALLTRMGSDEKFRLIQKIDSASGVAAWKTLLQKEIRAVARFGLKEDQIAPDGLLPMEEAHRVALIENALEPGKKASITVKPGIFEGGLWLTTGKGLPLVPVFGDIPSPRYSLLPSKKNGAFRLYAVAHGAVAEFAISGFANAMLFSSDKLQWPQGPRKGADDANVPK